MVRPPRRAAERQLVARDIAAIRTMAPVVIPEGAYLLTEGDYPREHLASVMIALVLLTFGIFNVAGLIRSRRLS